MATSSITKTFVIKDEKVCDKLIKALNDTPPRKAVKTNYYEEGKKKLTQYFGH
ncbi:MAG: hypothetical protein NC434_08875 [Ruminococcus sp.]|nr:hypothetical protein [Ruminococcus sp.]